jgi:diguanylate cyclase (GGDEF)-like protein
MAVLALDLLRSSSSSGFARGSRAPSAVSRRWQAWRAWVVAMLRAGVRTGPGAEGPGGAAIARRNRLVAYTGASIVLGLGLLAWTSLTAMPWAAIDPGFAPGTVLSGPSGGLLLWLVYGLLGSLRAMRAADGGTMTFHLPFIGAAMLLGGPTAGAWVAFLSSIERRELEEQPWYGILANHSVLVVAAVMGGLTTQVVGGLLGAEGLGTATLIAAVAGIAVLAFVSTGMGVITVVLREDITSRAFLGVFVGQFGRITLIEAGLVVVLAVAYTELGWWAPLLVGGFVVLAWDNNPMPGNDPLTGLPTADGFGRRLEAGLGWMRRGVTPGATLLAIDLDHFREVNDQYGRGVGDEVLREVAVRLGREGRRSNDVAGRLGGAYFALFLPGLAEVETAMRRAGEVAATLMAPIATSAGPVTIDVAIGVLVERSSGTVPLSGTELRRAEQAMVHAKRNGGWIHLYDPDEPLPFDDSWAEAGD